MAHCRKSFPDIPVYWLYEPPRLFKFGPRRSVEPGILIDMVKNHQLDGLDIQHACIDHELCKIADQAEIDIYAWTVDDPVTARRLLEIGVKGITTNRPELLKGNGL